MLVTRSALAVLSERINDDGKSAFKDIHYLEGETELFTNTLTARAVRL